jgi:hypothetical protein
MLVAGAAFGIVGYWTVGAWVSSLDRPCPHHEATTNTTISPKASAAANAALW